MRITLANLHEATAQQVFNQVASHLLAQGGRCMALSPNPQYGEPQPGCAYRSDDGKLACAAGSLISDEEMVKIHELGLNTGHGWSSLIDSQLAPETHEELIALLQEVHDGGQTTMWKKQLREIAEEFELTTEVLD